MTKTPVIQIKSWLTSDVIAETEAETLADAVVNLIANRSDLSDANLWGANLWGANLRDANLRGANLRGANLRGANLRGANLRGANLWGANLWGANLWGANLRDANLRGANLRGANLRGAHLPSPTAVLLACWPDLSPQLVADLMLFDAANHPDPTAFDSWAQGGPCPYNDVHVERAANFSQQKSLWGKGVACRPYDLMARVLAEGCPDWAAEKLAEFEARFMAKGGAE